MSFDEAIEKAMGSVEVVNDQETIDIRDSLGRILAQNIYAPRNNPPFNRATMDGFAVRSLDVVSASQDHPVKLSISGESYIGEARKQLAGRVTCFKISTGAIVPIGTDSVVKVESTIELDGEVEIYESVSPSENIAESGSDISSSELLVISGKEIETNDIAVLASLGIPRIQVFRKLRVGVISTGNELINYDDPYIEGRINDANGLVLSSELSSYPTVEASYSGIVKDNYDDIKARIEEELEHNDVVILSGGSSAGESDLVYRIIDDMNPGILFHGVLVKPGLPTVLGKSGRKVVIGLPGFPVSALMIFRSIFLAPIMKASRSSRSPVVIKGSLGRNLKLDMGKQNLVPVSVSGRSGDHVYPVTGLSGSISRFTSTSGFISLPGNTKFLETGTEVIINLWESRIGEQELIVSGLVFRDVYSPFAQQATSASFTRMMPRESLISLYNGDADISFFYITEDFDLDKEIIGAQKEKDLNISRGPGLTLGFAFKDDYRSTREVYSALKSGIMLSGPSLRFLSTILTENNNLTELCSYISRNISSYDSSSLVDSVQNLLASKASVAITSRQLAKENSLTFLAIAEIVPASIYHIQTVEELKTVFKMNELS